MVSRVSREAFAEIVRRALASLPDDFASAVEAVRFDVLDRPTARMIQQAGLPEGQTLLGLYHGRPATARSVEESGALPDIVYLFQREIEDMCDTEEELEEQIRKTVLHELGHHFGLDEDDLDELGYS